MTELHEAARRYLGVRWVHRGRSESELDCIGLIVLSERDCGNTLQDRTDYSRKPTRGMLEQELVANYAAPVSGLQPNDIVAMRFGVHGRVRHVGIVGRHPHGLSLIHTDSLIGRVVEQRLDEQLMARIAGVYRRAV